MARQLRSLDRARHRRRRRRGTGRLAVGSAGAPASAALVELQLPGGWLNISEHVRYEDRVHITRGRGDEATELDAASCTMTVNNRDGQFTPRNPTGPLYGLIGRNTPIRVSVPYLGGWHRRFTGEVSAWPQRWDLSGTDVYVPLVAAGVLRRLTQGATPLKSAMHRAVTADDAAAVAYWPCEDEDGATVMASALPGVAPMTIAGAPDLAAFDSFASSAPLPLLTGSRWTGAVPGYGVTDLSQVRFLLAIPAAGETNNTAIITIATTGGTLAKVTLTYTTAATGTISLAAVDVDDTTVGADTVATGVNGELLLISVELNPGLGNMLLTTTALKANVAGETSTSNLVARTLTRVSGVTVSPDSGLGAAAAAGHVSVHSAETDVEDLRDALHAYAGETAGRRVQRLCGEQGITFVAGGDLDDTLPMGAQPRDTLVAVLRECARTDLGMLFEPRDQVGLGYRPRRSLYNQTPRLALDYPASHLAGVPAPIDDDQATRNDVTVTRRGGSSARDQLTSGPLSIQSPPDGVGTYDDSVQVNTAGDGFLPDQASWRVHLGTVDEARYPQLPLNLARAEITEGLRLAVLDVDVGDRITIADPPAWLPPDDISVLMQGTVEDIDQLQHELVFTTSPASPYQVGTFDESSRYDTPGTTLDAGVDVDDTSLTVSTIGGVKWSATSVPYDLRLGGLERITVTAVAGGSPAGQVLTVTRSVNGAVMAHAAGAALSLWTPARYAL